MDPSAFFKDGGTYRTATPPVTTSTASYQNTTSLFNGIVLPEEMRAFNGVFYAIFLPLSMLGNIYCVIVVTVIVGHQPIRKSIPDILVGTLSCVELFSIASFHSLSVIAMMNSAWIFPPSVCAVQSFSVCLYISLEFLVQAAISLDRYIALTTPFRYQRWGSAATVRLVICGIIALSIVISILLKVTSQVESHLLSTWYLCISTLDLAGAAAICVMVAASLVLGSSFVIIIVCNLHLVRTLCQYNSLGVSNAMREVTDAINGSGDKPLPSPLPLINSSINAGLMRPSICSAMDRKDSAFVLTTPRKSRSSIVPSGIQYFTHRASVASHVVADDHISSEIEGVTYNFTTECSDKDTSDTLDKNSDSDKGKTNHLMKGDSLSVTVPKLSVSAPPTALVPHNDCSIMITIEEASGDENSPTRTPTQENNPIPKIELIDEENNINKTALGITSVNNGNVSFGLVPEITIESEADDPSMTGDPSGHKPEDVYLTPGRPNDESPGLLTPLRSSTTNESSLLTPQTAMMSGRLSPNSLCRSSFSNSLDPRSSFSNSLDPSMALRRASARSIASMYAYSQQHRPSHLSIPGQDLEANPFLYMSYIQRQVTKVVRLMEKAANRQKREVVLARVVFINACVFVITWLPFIATIILMCWRVTVPDVISDISLKLVFLHALINPVFHGLCRHNYRKGFLFISRTVLHYITLGYIKTPGEDLVFYESRRRKVKRHLQAAAQIRTDRGRRRRQSAMCVQQLSAHLSTHRLSVQPPPLTPTVLQPTPTPSRSRTSSHSASASPADFAPTPHLQNMFEQYLEETDSDSQLSSIDYDALDMPDPQLMQHLATSFMDLYEADLYRDLEGGDAELEVECSEHLLSPPPHSA